MALNQSSLRASTLLSKGCVRADRATDGALFFFVNKTSVRFDLRKKLWMCTCQHEGWRGNKINRTCYHIRACEQWMKQKGKQK